MPRVEANPTPVLLRWARESAGLSVEAAAKKANVAPERIAAWESGDSRPTFPQLRKLAEIYKRPLAVFYLKDPPLRFHPMHDFRRQAGQVELPRSPELTMEIRKAHDRREWAMELYKEIEEEPPDVQSVIATEADPEVAATTVRNFLRASLNNQVTWRTEYEAFREWRLLVERAGILTFQAVGVEVQEARGFSISERPLPVAVANIKDAPRGRIFTLLHEVAHILLRDGGICDLHESDEDESSRVEAFCNHVAGAALFPRTPLLNTDVVRQHPKGDPAWSDDELAALSRLFGGSREAALVRLLTLGLTTNQYYHRRRDYFLRLYAAQRQRQSGFVPPHEVALTSAGPTFTGLVLENFNRERITASDVSDYLQIRLKHLPEVQRDYAKYAV
jgi:Zn-dependent peptidase ImmA (M78 family)/DNA-binding XRE family transcriptional regulator